MNSEELEKQADLLLRKNGCRKDGRPSGSVDFGQMRLERRIKGTGMTGLSRKSQGKGS